VIHRGRPIEWRRNAQEGNLPKVLQAETSRKSALLTVTMVSALAMAQWFMASESVPAAPAPGTIIVAQNPPPKCGQDPQHPCPKEAPKEAPKQPAQQQQQQQAPKPQAQPQQPPPQQAPKQQAQPQPQPAPPSPQIHQQAQPQPTPVQPQPKDKEQAQPKQNQQNQQKPVVQQPVQPTVQSPVQTQQHTLPTPGQPVQTQGQPQGQQPQQGQQVVPGQQRPAQGQPVTPQGQQPQQGQQVVPGQQQKIQPAQGQPAQPGPAGQQRIQPAQGQPQGQQPVQTFQRLKPLPGQPGWVPPVQQSQGGPGKPAPAPVAAGPGFVNVQDLRAQRHEHTDPNGRVVIEEPDHRQIVREGGQAFVRHDENERLFQFGEGRRERRGDGMYAIIDRPDGDEIITVTDDDGRLIRRFRRERDGREFILIDNRRPRGETIFLNLPVPIIGIPQDQYIVDTGVAPEPFIYQTLAAPPLVPIERPYSLDEIRYNVALRDRMRRIDVDSINFDTGSWEVSPDQVARLQFVAQAIQDALARNPNEVFLVEGHTDAVGTDVDNLSLSDRRAETVAGILTESFQIPPENLTSQGYGSHYLKVPTPEANRQNRRVTVRRITPLLNGGNG
jgi:outer membrane protein OmpA-like peptidoglycan-associated protein